MKNRSTNTMSRKPAVRVVVRGCNMAAEAGALFSGYEQSVGKQLNMLKLRDSGKEYISKAGKVMPAKVQPDVFCTCPQKCQRKLPKEIWRELFRQFYSLEDNTLQNQFLQAHIIIKAVHLNNWDTEATASHKRRVTCKYHVPIIEDNDSLKNHITNRAENTVEICQKAFMNVFGITEKRIRMQREKCIASIAPNHYKISSVGKTPPDDTSVKENFPEATLSNNVDSDPVNTSNSCTDDKQMGDEPLDLSNHMERSLRHLEIDKTQLYELADKMGLPRKLVDKEMSGKFEEMVRTNLRKHQNRMVLEKKDSKSYKNGQTLRGISQQVVGLGDDLAILPIQTLNNGDLTITPILGPEQEVENMDIMRVNTFFQNQLWKPEYIGLGKNQKLW